MNRQVTLAVLLAGLLLLAGCADKQSHHTVGFGGNVTYTDGTFTMDGEVYVNSGAAEPQTYPNVTVVLYAANETRLDTIRLGTMSASNESGEAPVRRFINVTRPYRPAYVVIESPGFWGEERPIPADAFEWEENLSFYDRYSVIDPDEKLSGD